MDQITPRQKAADSEDPAKLGDIVKTTKLTGNNQIIGEGSYEGTQDYADGMRKYLREADVAQDAADAAPDSPMQARELKDAEQAAASHTKAPGK